MHCRFFNEVSDEWVDEELSCINHNELRLEREIDELFKSKCEIGPRYFTAVEFSKFLKWKGLARRIPAFINRYNNNGEIEEITKNLFTSKLMQFAYADIQNELLKGDILIEIGSLFNHLHSQLDYVGKAVASACLALCFPDLCVTADYIVPGLLHNGLDINDKPNPLFLNPRMAQLLHEALIMPAEHSLSAYQARNIATRNYTSYVQEFWNIKRIFGLTEDVRKIEAAIWSFGICYFRKWRGYSDSQALTFKYEPNPPKGGPFSKTCPNESGTML
jgi:hypothetical protein